MSLRKYLALDVGERRLGLAYGDSDLKTAWPLVTLEVGSKETEKLKDIISQKEITDIVVGRPRNQAGELTAQTKLVEAFVTRIIQPLGLPIHWQDESLTSVMAEQRLGQSAKGFSKGDIDAEAAVMILQDFLESL